jgi:hypothetical protein
VQVLWHFGRRDDPGAIAMSIESGPELISGLRKFVSAEIIFGVGARRLAGGIT